MYCSGIAMFEDKKVAVVANTATSFLIQLRSPRFLPVLFLLRGGALLKCFLQVVSEFGPGSSLPAMYIWLCCGTENFSRLKQVTFLDKTIVPRSIFSAI